VITRALQIPGNSVDALQVLQALTKWGVVNCSGVGSGSTPGRWQHGQNTRDWGAAGVARLAEAWHKTGREGGWKAAAAELGLQDSDVRAPSFAAGLAMSFSAEAASLIHLIRDAATETPAA